MGTVAGKDQIIDNDATRQFFNRFRFAKRELREYRDAEHTLEFEPLRGEFIADLLHWMKTLNSQS